MQKKFLSSLSLLVVLNLLIKPFFLLGIDAEVQNQVGPSEYGLYFALLNLSFIFNILIDLGINNYNNRNISRYSYLISKHFTKLFSLKATLSLVYAGFTLILGLLLGYKGYSFTLLGVLIVNQVLVSFILFVRSNLTALQFFKKDSILSVLDRFLLIIFCGILLWGNVTGTPFRIEWFIYLQTAAYLFTLIVGFIMLGRHVGRFRYEIDRPFSIKIISKSAPYALFILLVSFYNRLDGIMLENLLNDGSEQAGFYAQGFRFFDAANMFAYLFSVLLLPIFSGMLKKRENVQPLLNMSSRILVGIAVFAAIFCLFFGTELLRLRYVSVNAFAGISFSLLMVGFIGNCMFYTYGTLLTANANLRQLNLISLSGLLLNLILNLILIPQYAAIGAALATMITQIFAGITQMLVCYRKFNFKPDSTAVLRFSLFMLLFGGLNYFLDQQQADVVLTLCISLVAGIALILLLRVFQIRDLLDVVRMKD